MTTTWSNPYIWPTLAQSGALALLGVYGLLFWRRAPRLALAGLVALMLLGLFGAHLPGMTAEPAIFAQHGGAFLPYTSAFLQLFVIALCFQLASSFLSADRVRVMVIACALCLVAWYLVVRVGHVSSHESIGLVDAVLADYGRMGRIPVPVFWGAGNTIVGLLVVLPVFVLAGSSRVLFQRSMDWLRLSPWTVVSALLAFSVSLSQLYVRMLGADFSQLMELTQFSFYVAVFTWVVAYQAELAGGSFRLRQVVGGAAIGIYSSSLAQLFNVPFTFTHVTNLWISALSWLVVGGLLVYQIYIKLATRFEAEMEASRQERLAAIGRLASVTAHEIRNPLQAIRSFSQFIGSKAKGSDLQSPADLIMKEIDRLDAILKRLLDFSRELRLTLAEVQLGEWWAELKGLAREMTGESNVNCLWSDPPNDIALFDSEKMRQVFVNVFKNAMEASPVGGQINSSLSLDKGRVVLRVEDEGPGIGPQEAERVFKEFHTTKADGSGLGLPISKRILEAHGGRIYFDLTASKGAAVVAEWPKQPPGTVLRRSGLE